MKYLISFLASLAIYAIAQYISGSFICGWVGGVIASNLTNIILADKNCKNK